MRSNPIICLEQLTNGLHCGPYCGAVSEWFMETVLKTVEQQCSVGSNPTRAAKS